MKHELSVALLGLLAGVLSAAETDPKTEIKSAARKLADKPSYSWTANIKNEGDATSRQNPIQGKAEKGGYVYLSFALGDNTIECAFKGDKSAIKRDTAWESADELAGEDAWIARRLRIFKAPAAEAEDLLGKVKELKKAEDGVYSGDLTEAGANDWITRMRRSGSAAPKGAKGSVKYWLKGGELVKYEFNVQGTITAGNDDREVPMNRTTTVEIKNVGTTQVQVPEAARKKLS